MTSRDSRAGWEVWDDKSWENFSPKPYPLPPEKEKKERKKGTAGQYLYFYLKERILFDPHSVPPPFSFPGRPFFQSRVSFFKKWRGEPPVIFAPSHQNRRKGRATIMGNRPSPFSSTSLFKTPHPLSTVALASASCYPRPRGWGLLVVNGLRKRKKSLLIPTTPVQGAGEEEEAAAAAEMQISDIYICIATAKSPNFLIKKQI